MYQAGHALIPEPGFIPHSLNRPRSSESPQVRSLFGFAAIVVGAFALVLAALAVQLWRRGEGRTFDRAMLTATVAVASIYVVSLAGLAG
jgi:uncharacterized membrane protein YozB (DUF420 family)